MDVPVKEDLGRMMKTQLIIGIVGLGLLIFFGIFISYAVISASLNGWEHTFAFNDYHEGIVELILFPLVTIMGIYSAYRYLDILAKKRAG